eukprot:m.238047 g.238047  ORF g.238047 m.238047 type:complete len:525 (+) comp19380_c0_seq3:257-1831(+)
MSQSSSDEDSDEAPGYDDAAATATSRRRRNMVELAKSFLLTEAEESDEDYVGGDDEDYDNEETEEDRLFIAADDEEETDGGVYFGDPIAAAARAKREKRKKKARREARREELRQRHERHRSIAEDEGGTETRDTVDGRHTTPTRMLCPEATKSHRTPEAFHRQSSKADSRLSSIAVTQKSSHPNEHRGRLKRKNPDADAPARDTDKRARAAGPPQKNSGGVHPFKPVPQSTRKLPLDHRRFARRLRGATTGKIVDTQRIISVFKELEKYTPTKEDLEDSILLVGIIVHFKKTGSNPLLRYHCKRMYKYWKAIIAGKPDATLAPWPGRSKQSAERTAPARRTDRGGASGSGPQKPKGVAHRTPTNSPSARARTGPRPGARANSPNPKKSSTLQPQRKTIGKSALQSPATLGTPPPATAGKTAAGKSSLFRDLSKGAALEFRHHWPMFQKRIGTALKADPPDVDKALVNLDKLAASSATRSALEDAIAGGLVADLKAYRKHPDSRVATRCAKLFAEYKTLMTNKFV